MQLFPKNENVKGEDPGSTRRPKVIRNVLWMIQYDDKIDKALKHIMSKKD